MHNRQTDKWTEMSTMAIYSMLHRYAMLMHCTILQRMYCHIKSCPHTIKLSKTKVVSFYLGKGNCCYSSHPWKILTCYSTK